MKQWYEVGKNIILVSNSTNYDDLTKQMCINEISNLRNKIVDHIKDIVPDFDTEILKQYEEMHNKVENTMHTVYKKMLLDDLVKKEYNVVTKVIDEIKKSFFVFDKSLESQLNDILDIEILIKQHKNNILTKESVMNLGNYFVKLINSLEAPAAVKTTNSKWELIKSEGDELICDMLIFVLNEIEDIKQNIINIQICLSLGFSPF